MQYCTVFDISPIGQDEGPVLEAFLALYVMSVAKGVAQYFHCVMQREEMD